MFCCVCASLKAPNLSSAVAAPRCVGVALSAPPLDICSTPPPLCPPRSCECSPTLYPSEAPRPQPPQRAALPCPAPSFPVSACSQLCVYTLSVPFSSSCCCAPFALRSPQCFVTQAPPLCNIPFVLCLFRCCSLSTHTWRRARTRFNTHERSVGQPQGVRSDQISHQPSRPSSESAAEYAPASARRRSSASARSPAP